MEMEKMPKPAIEFECKLCNFKCCKKSNWLTHMSTSKHYSRVVGNCPAFLEPNKKMPKNQNIVHRCSCGKKYTTLSGLWKHSKKCDGESKEINLIDISNENIIIPNPSSQTDPSTDVEKLTVMFIESIKQNQDFQKQMFELLKDNIGSTHTNSHNTSNVNSHNNFNLNFFLNETCKDAMNIKDFINSLQVHFKDLEYNGENGYAAGISKIFLRELNQLDVCKRPIHCSDAKREVFHIKNEDSWEKERELLIKCIKQITRKNVILLADWREAHPGCMNLDNKMNDQYNKINCETMGPYLDDEELKCFNKIISSVAKATIIDKKCGATSR
jgi:hypothetical protein